MLANSYSTGALIVEGLILIKRGNKKGQYTNVYEDEN